MGASDVEESEASVRDEAGKIVAAGISRALALFHAKSALENEAIDMFAISHGRVLPNPSAYPGIKSRADAEARLRDIKSRLSYIGDQEHEMADGSLLSDERGYLWQVCDECRRLLFCMKLVAHALNDARAKRQVGNLLERVARAKAAEKVSVGLPIASEVRRDCLSLLKEYTNVPEAELMDNLSLPSRLMDAEQQHEQRLDEALAKEQAMMNEGAKACVSAAAKGARRGGAAFMREYVNNQEMQENGRSRRPGAGAKARYDTNGQQMELAWKMSQKSHYESAAKLAHYVICKECAASTNPFVFPAGSSSEEQEKVKTAFVKRFKTWCRKNGKIYPFA